MCGRQVLACYPSLRSLQSVQNMGSRGRKSFLLLSLEISVPGAFSYPTARQHQMHHIRFCHFVTPPHRNALPDSPHWCQPCVLSRNVETLLLFRRPVRSAGIMLRQFHQRAPTRRQRFINHKVTECALLTHL